MKNNLRKIFVDSYNQKLTSSEIAKKLQNEVQGLSKTRAMAIARTETMRASNLSDYVNAKLNMGAKSYHVLGDPNCCDKCSKIYKNGDQWFDIEDIGYFPPNLHPNCRCTGAYSTKTAAEKVGEYNARVGKSEYINSLNENEIKKYDNTLFTKIPEESQIAHRKYSHDSDIFNNYYRLSEKEFKKFLKLENLNIKEVEKNIANLKKGSIVLKEDLVVYRGFDIKNIDPIKLKTTEGFISTSLDEAISIGYTRGTGRAIKITIPKGTRVMYVKDYSIYPNHLEVVIPPEYCTVEYKVSNQLLYKIVKR